MCFNYFLNICVKTLKDSYFQIKGVVFIKKSSATRLIHSFYILKNIKKFNLYNKKNKFQKNIKIIFSKTVLKNMEQIGSL